MKSAYDGKKRTKGKKENERKITAAFSHFIVPNDVKKIRRIVKKKEMWDCEWREGT